LLIVTQIQAFDYVGPETVKPNDKGIGKYRDETCVMRYHYKQNGHKYLGQNHNQKPSNIHPSISHHHLTQNTNDMADTDMVQAETNAMETSLATETYKFLPRGMSPCKLSKKNDACKRRKDE
jgi:hypothetical protein